MSRYRVAEQDPAYPVEVGWLADGPGGYWYAVFEAATGQMVDQGGFEQGLPTVADVVAATWPVVNWPAERAVMIMLRDDPWVERLTAEPGPLGMAELFAETLAPVVSRPATR